MKLKLTKSVCQLAFWALLTPIATYAQSVLSVQSTQTQSAVWPQTINANGAIAAWQEASLSAEVSGLKIVGIYADVGQKVKRGQLIAQLATDSTLAELTRQRALVAQAQAVYTEAHGNAERARSVQNNGAISAQQAEQYLSAEANAIAALDAAKAQLKLQSIKLQQTRIAAPDEGVISARTAVLGSVVNTGTELFKMIRQGRTDWQAQVNAKQLGQIKVGQNTLVQLSDGRKLNGKVRSISPSLDSQTRNATVYVQLPNGSAEPGQFATGTITIGTQAAQAIIQSAIVIRDGNSYLFEIVKTDKDLRVAQRLVRTGRRQDGLVEILDTLKPNTKYVLSGVAFLSDGDKVTLVEKAK